MAQIYDMQIPKHIVLTPKIATYMARHSTRADTVLEELRAETDRMGQIREMMISVEQGVLLSLLTKSIDTRLAVEIGTFTGYSSVCIARALPSDGRLLCFDNSEEWTAMARRYWQRANLEGKIELRLGDGAKQLRAFFETEPQAQVDFAFVDADKTGYDTYYELFLPRMRPNGVVVFDNMLWGGSVVTGPMDDPDVIAVDALNRKLGGDPRVESVLLPVADGIQLCRKREAAELEQ
jgi:caffeoyl-CoA O-methyltransferase